MNSDGEDDRIEDHVRLVRMLIQTRGSTPQQAIEDAGHLIPATEHAAVLQRYEEQTATAIQVLKPQVLSQSGTQSWFDQYNPEDGYYWRRQRAFLVDQLHRRDFEIDSLDQASNAVLAHLGDPHSKDHFDVRGLVVGHVQSGKTANFSAVIAKAADAGYKIVIVLSGLHNTLRQQTQRRLERDLGREGAAGVGEPKPGMRWQWMTDGALWGDFTPGAVSAALLQGNEHVVFVVKKNKSRLEKLNQWMLGRVPEHVPVLVIDDEADQASVNTGGSRAVREEADLMGGSDFAGEDPADDETDPSVINLNIRKLLQNFARCSYVAYTATPFANVLINPTAFDFEGGSDLFPRDFILTLPPPPGDSYVGPAQLFGRDALPGESENVHGEGLDVIEFVPDEEVQLLLPTGRNKTGFRPILPPSLKAALLDFVLASAAWLERSGEDQPCTMLIHTGMQRAVQNPLAPEVATELARIRQQWLYGRAEFRPLVKERWETEFRPVTRSVDVARDVPFEQIEPALERLLRDGIEVRVLNSDWPDKADFDAEPKLKSVLIGGNKLSRGVTLEGLLVSYYVRETLYYDTLMQMARWFGYRGRYVDLTRLYSTKELVGCFHDLATAEEELRRQVARYEREHVTPREFVPKVRTHPLMSVTQPSKMQAAIPDNVSYAGELVQTLRFPEKPVQGFRHNLEATRRLLSSLAEPSELTHGKPCWYDVPASRVLAFLAECDTQVGGIDRDSVMAYIDAQREYGELTSWTILLSCAAKPSDMEGWADDLGVVGMPEVPLVSRSRLKNDPTSLGVVTSPDDELVGLSRAAILAAREDAAGGSYRLREAYRARRDPSEGLLIIYPISPRSDAQGRNTNRIPLFATGVSGVPTVIAYALSFPISKSQATVKYVSVRPPGGQA